MKKVFAIIGLGLCLSACETYDPYAYDTGYYGYGPRYGYGYGRYHRNYGRYIRARECYEVRDEYNARFLECRHVRRWRQDASPKRDYD